MEQLKKNIFITGGTGFIGKNLQEYLSPKFNIFAPSHKEFDLLDEERVQQYIINNKIDVIVHCANVGGGRDTIGLLDVVSQNLRMFFNLVRNLDKVKKMVHLGSGAEYDLRFYKPKMKEDYFDIHIPIDDYGFSKYICSKYILSSKENIAGLRLFGIFGKYEKYYLKFISNAIVKNLLSLPITIKQNVYFDYLYIDDLVKIIEYFITHDTKEKIYNVTPTKRVNLVSIAELVNRIGDNESKIIILNEGLRSEYNGDNSRLLKEMSDFQFTPIEKAIQELYNWYKINSNSIDRDLIKKGDQYITYNRIRKE